MNFISRLHKGEERTANQLQTKYESTRWAKSVTVPGARYCIRRSSLRQRIELVKRAQELSLRTEYLKAGGDTDQFEATLTDLYVQQLYLEWGLVEVAGFTIDGEKPSVDCLIERGPEALVKEIVEAIQKELSLSEDERKNS